MSQPLSPLSNAPVDVSDRRIRRSWWVFSGSFLALGLIVLLRLGTEGASLLDWTVIALLVVAGAAGLFNRQAVSSLEAGRRAEAESFARILSGLSRSISPDAILAAIVDELARATEADHIVVIRRRPDARVLDATLISARAGVANSTTQLPIADLEDPVFETHVVEREPVSVAVMADTSRPVAVGAGVAAGTELGQARVDALIGRGGRARPERPDALFANGTAQAGATGPRNGLPVSPGRDGQMVADRIAARVRRVYGLRRTLAAPLTSDDGVVGAIVLSHRSGAGWSATTRRLLTGAA